MVKILVTSASFQDTPGRHLQLLSEQGFDITFLKGITKTKLLQVIAGFDGLLCGDDNITAEVLAKGKAGRLKYVSKYGVGVDKIDLQKAFELQIPVTNCPGVNQVSVAELVFALLLSFARNIHLEYAITKAGGWQKMTGFEIYNKTIGIVGFGAIGREVAKRAMAFGMHVLVHTTHPPLDYIKTKGYQFCNTLSEMASQADILTLHIPLTAETRQIINNSIINDVKPGLIIINTSRGGLIDTNAVVAGLANGLIGGYLTDVLEEEPMAEDEPLRHFPNGLITPHIGSRTFESVERQGVMAVENLVNMVAGNEAAYRSRLVLP